MQRLAGLIVLGCLAASATFADQIVMKDGDRITGRIVKKDGSTVTVASRNFGTVTLNWDDIATVKTEEALNVVLSGDQTVKGAIESRGERIAVAVPGGERTVEPAGILALRNDAEQKAYERLRHPGLLDLWTINGSLNLAGTKGNAKTLVITTPLNFARVSSTSKTTAYFNAIRSTATVNGVNAQTANAVRGGWGYSRNLTKRMFLNGFNDYEYDKFQSLDLRVVLGGGAGWHAWKGEHGSLDLVGGGAWNREKFDPAPQPAYTRSSGEAYWGDDFAYKLNARTSLTQSFRMFNNLSRGGEYRMNFDVGATTALTKWLNWSVAVSDRYLSNPVPGRMSNDLLYTTGLGFTFAR